MMSGTETFTPKLNFDIHANYNPSQRILSTTMTQIHPTSTFIAATTLSPSQSQFTVASTTNASTSPVYSATGVCSNVADLYTTTSGTGTLTPKVSRDTDANYNAAERTQSTTAT